MAQLAGIDALFGFNLKIKQKRKALVGTDRARKVARLWEARPELQDARVRSGVESQQTD